MNPCTERLLSESVAYADRLTAQGIVRSKALRHASQRFGFTAKQIMSASGRARIDPTGELSTLGILADNRVTIGIFAAERKLDRALA